MVGLHYCPTISLSQAWRVAKRWPRRSQIPFGWVPIVIGVGLGKYEPALICYCQMLPIPQVGTHLFPKRLYVINQNGSGYRLDRSKSELRWQEQLAATFTTISQVET